MERDGSSRGKDMNSAIYLTALSILACIGSALSAAPAVALNFTYRTIAGDGVTNVFGINDLGTTVGTDESGSFTENNGIFNPIQFPSDEYAYATAINDQGNLVGLKVDSNNSGFLDIGGAFTDLSIPSAPSLLYTHPNDVNASNAVAGYYDSLLGGRNYFQGFLYAAGTYTTINDPNSSPADYGSVVRGVNDEGDIVGSYYTDNFQGEISFLYKNGVFTNLQYPGADYTEASGITDSGEIVGTYTVSNGGPAHGFVDINGTFSSLQMPVPFIDNTVIQGVNNYGVVAGYYHNYETGETLGFTAAPVTEPSTWVGMLTGFMATGLMLRKRVTATAPPL
jgi:uncharacterized membrane protein